MKARRIVLTLVLGLLAFGAVSASPALAVPPERHVLQLTQITPDTILSNLCGFQVLRYTNVAATVDTFRTHRGDPKRVLIHQDGVLEFRANGQTVEGFSTTVENIRFSEGVSGNVVLDEDVTWMVLPGHGPGLHVTGHLRAEFDDQGDVTLFQNTLPDLSEPAICTALAP